MIKIYLRNEASDVFHAYRTAKYSTYFVSRKSKQTTPNKRLEKNKLVFVLTSQYRCRKLGCDSGENVCVKCELMKTAGVCCKDMAVIKNDHRLNVMFNRPFNIMSKIAIKPRL